MQNRVLLIEDNSHLRSSIKQFLSLKKYSVIEAVDIRSAQEWIAQTDFDIFLLDLSLPDGNGLDFFMTHKAIMKDRTIIMTASNSVEAAVKAMRNGVYDYLEKPVKMDHLMVRIRKAIDLSQANRKIRSLEKQISILNETDQLIFEDQKMKQILNMAKEIAVTDFSVLLMGETGVGKDMLAQYIHQHSRRNNKEFLEINCSTLMESMIVPELFGYKKGAFTGADSGFKGRFIQANGGTLFLNEIGDLPIPLQPQLLSVIESKKIMPLGSEKILTSDFRLITATNIDLERAIAEQRFRNDLFYRIKEFSISIPPLRERKADIIPIFRHFLSQYSSAFNRQITKITNEAEKILRFYQWPGNIRELKQIAKVLITRLKGTVVDDHLIGEILEIQNKFDKFNFIPLKEYSANYVKQVLSLSDNNIKKCSEILQVSRNTIYKILKEQ